MTLPDVDTFITTYGGVRSDAAMPVIDPTTDRSAAGMNSFLLTVAALTRVVPRAYVTITLGGSPVLVKTRGTYDAVWGTNYVPLVARIGTGHSQVTFPTTVLDAEWNSHVVNIRWCDVIPGLGVPFAQPVLTSANVVDLWYGNFGGVNDFSSAYTLRMVIG